jgi:hypothetical protein
MATLDSATQINEIADLLDALPAEDARAFERDWSFALSAIESGGEKYLTDDEIPEMLAELRASSNGE